MSVEVNPETPGAAGDDEVRALRQERDELQDRLLRSAAEFDNYRKRTDRERRELSDAVSADVISDLLPVLDDMERALAAADETPSASMRAGLELIHKQFLEALRRRGAEPVESVGQDFDPTWHEALSTEPAGDRRDGEIVQEVRRGYRIGSRLIRPALVKVAKA